MGMPLRLADYLVSPRRCTVDSPVGPLMVIADNTGITHILFPTHTLADLGLVSEDVPEAKDDPVLLNAARQLAEYFDGDRTAFDLPLHVEGNDFEVDVWFAMRSIPMARPSPTVNNQTSPVTLGHSKPWALPMAAIRSRSSCPATE